jgi:hypothetical protein
VVGHLRPLLDCELLALDMRFERSLLNNMAHTRESAASCTRTPRSHHRTHARTRHLRKTSQGSWPGRKLMPTSGESSRPA